MANLNQTIDIIFNGIDRTGDAFGTVGDRLGSFNDKVQNVVQPLSNLADQLLKLEASAIAVGTAFGAYAVTKAAEFESAQADLAKVLDETDPKIGAFTATVDDLSVKYGEAATNILQGIANFKQAGFSAKESAELQRNAMDLVIAGDLEASEASDLLVRSLKGFGAPAAEAAHFIDALNEVSNKYATDVRQLAGGMADLSPIAKTMGFSFDQATGLLTPIIEVFGSGSEAADALKTGLLRLIDNSKPVVEALGQLGISQTDLNGHMKSGKDVFFEVAGAFKGMDDNQKLFFTQQLVGIDQAAKMVKVFDNLEQVMGVTETAMNSSGSAAKEVAIRLDTLEQQTSSAVVAFENLSRAVGVQLSKEVGGVASGFTDLGVAFKNVVEGGGLEPLFAALRPYMEDFEATLKRIAENLPAAFEKVDFSGLTRAFGDLVDEGKTLFEDLFGKVDLSTPEGLASAIQRVVDGLTMLTNIAKGIGDAMEPYVKTLGKMIDTTSKAGSENQNTIGQILGWSKVIDLVNPIVKEFTATLDLLQAGLAAFASKQLITAAEGLTAIGSSTSRLLPLLGKAGLVGAAADAGYAVGTVLGNAIDDFIAKRTKGDSLGTWIYSLVHGSEDLNTSTATASSGLANFGKAIDGAGQSAAVANTKFKPIDLGNINFVVEAAKRLGLSLDDAGSAVDDFVQKNTKIEHLSTGYDKITDALGNLHYVWAGATDAAAGYKKVVDELGNVSYVQVGGGIEKANKGFADQKSKMDEAKDSAKALSDELDRAAKERLAIIEYRSKVDVEQIKADAERVKAAFDSVGKAIDSTGDTLSNLVGTFAKMAETDPFNAGRVRDLMDAENKRRDQAFELQKKLTDEQIRYMQARREQMLRGDPLIRVEATNLKPALEMIFVEIMQYIQVRANAEGLELLLGV
jgi:TP901 family phage tail tape measure protein